MTPLAFYIKRIKEGADFFHNYLQPQLELLLGK